MGNITPNYGLYQPSQTEQFDIDVCVNNNLDVLDGALKAINDRAVEALTRANQSIQVGEVKMYAGSSVPAGFLEMNGALVSRFSYPELFSILGYNYGGSGSLFQLPDMSGRVPVGMKLDDTDFNRLGKFGGSKTHTLTKEQLAPHIHNGLNWASERISLNKLGGTIGYKLGWEYGGVNDSLNINVGSTVSGEPHNNLQPYLTLKYIIKY